MESTQCISFRTWNMQKDVERARGRVQQLPLDGQRHEALEMAHHKEPRCGDPRAQERPRGLPQGRFASISKSFQRVFKEIRMILNEFWTTFEGVLRIFKEISVRSSGGPRWGWSGRLVLRGGRSLEQRPGETASIWAVEATLAWSSSPAAWRLPFST